jgi:hypothetical protein
MRYKDKGLVILGFNCSDDKKIALEMLRENGATFPNIIDSSEAATSICFRKLQRSNSSAVPMSYMIDRNGDVMDAWYGYDDGHPQAIAALKKAGGELAEEIRKEENAKNHTKGK